MLSVVKSYFSQRDATQEKRNGDTVFGTCNLFKGKKKGHRPASHFAPIVLKATKKMANLSKSMDELFYLKQLNK